MSIRAWTIGRRAGEDSRSECAGIDLLPAELLVQVCEPSARCRVDDPTYSIPDALQRRAVVVGTAHPTTPAMSCHALPLGFWGLSSFVHPRIKAQRSRA